MTVSRAISPVPLTQWRWGTRLLNRYPTCMCHCHVKLMTPLIMRKKSSRSPADRRSVDTYFHHCRARRGSKEEEGGWWREEIREGAVWGFWAAKDTGKKRKCRFMRVVKGDGSSLQTTPHANQLILNPAICCGSNGAGWQTPHLSRCLCRFVKRKAWVASILWPIIYALLLSNCPSKSILSKRFNVGCNAARTWRHWCVNSPTHRENQSQVNVLERINEKLL